MCFVLCSIFGARFQTCFNCHFKETSFSEMIQSPELARKDFRSLIQNVRTPQRCKDLASTYAPHNILALLVI